ncbi:adenylate cyclase type 10-like isoform X2 [Antedon mediterranea]
MFLDVSGFTACCEEYQRRNLGVDTLMKTLNNYLGRIEDVVLDADGDVVEFAGDALLVLWQATTETKNSIVGKVVKCAHEIHRRCHDWKTEVGVVLGVKVAISYGAVSITYVGNLKSQHFVTGGTAVIEVNKAEKHCQKGYTVLAKSAFKLCPWKDLIRFELLDEGSARVKLVKKAWLTKYEEEGSQENVESPNKKRKQSNRDSGLFRRSSYKNKLRPFIAPPVIQKIEDDQPLDYLCEMREVTIVFINLVLQTGDHTSCLQELYNTIGASVLQFQGMINKIFEFDKGTSFLIIFGLPGFKHENEIGHALQCSSKIQQSLKIMSTIKQVSIGVTTGKVFCGVVGHPSRHEYTVIGPRVNMAARLMMNYPSKLSCDESTCTRSKIQMSHFEDLPAVTLKGMENPGKIFEFHEVAKDEDTGITATEHPLLGYKTEVEECICAISDTMNSTEHVRFVIVKGEPGFGKSRVLLTLADEARKANIRVINHSANLSHACTPYYTASYIVKSILELGKVGSPEEKEKYLQEKFKSSDIIKFLGLLNNLIGVQLPCDETVGNMSTGDRTKAMHRLLGRIVAETQGDYEGTVVTIDDAHQIDKDSWQLLSNFAIRSCVIIMAVGPIGDEDQSADIARKVMKSQNTYIVTLKGLQSDTLEPLICQCLDVNEIPQDLVNLLRSNMKGKINPSWVKQCVLSLLHTDQLQLTEQEDGNKVCIVAKGVKLRELEIPESLRGCLIALIDRLPVTERTMVKLASVIGTTFSADTLGHLLQNLTTSKVQQTIGNLLSSGVFVFRAMMLRFESTSLQETAYSLLIDKQRRKLHETYASYLESQYFEQSTVRTRRSLFKKKTASPTTENRNVTYDVRTLQSIFPQLITHWRKANNTAKALEYLIKAADSAVAVNNMMQAISYILQAKELDPPPSLQDEIDQIAARATMSLFSTRKRRFDVKVQTAKWKVSAKKKLDENKVEEVMEKIQAKPPKGNWRRTKEAPTNIYQAIGIVPTTTIFLTMYLICLYIYFSRVM